MARAWRIEYEGALYHVLSRVDERQAIFLDNEDRGRFWGPCFDVAWSYAIGLRKIPIYLFNGLNRRTDASEKPLVFYPRQVFQKTFSEANLHCPPSNIEKTFFQMPGRDRTPIFKSNMMLNSLTEGSRNF